MNATDKTVDYLTEIGNHFDVFTSDVTAARAIVDCGAVLAALERSPDAPGSEMALGSGFANGLQMRDASLADMLKHALELLDMAHNEADVMREIAVNALKALQAKGASNG